MPSKQKKNPPSSLFFNLMQLEPYLEAEEGTEGAEMDFTIRFGKFWDVAPPGRAGRAPQQVLQPFPTSGRSSLCPWQGWSWEPACQALLPSRFLLLTLCQHFLTNPAGTRG